MSAASTRAGIASGGNWVVDKVKTVDRLPGRGMLANIKSEALSTGGAPANVLVDLARLGARFPLAGVGVVGKDEGGAFILDTCRRHRIDTGFMVSTDREPTSYTDVMSEAASGHRTFFHQRGANRLFGPEHVAAERLTCRIFHLGYLLLLDAMDQPDADYGTVAARVLAGLQRHGIRTSVDVVSEESDRFRTLVPPSLRYADYLIINEIEAGRSVGRTVRGEDGKLNPAELAAAVEDLHALGSIRVVAVHMPEGVYGRTREGVRFSLGSLTLPEGFIAGSVGAGDAFCAGMLYGLHEGWDVVMAARLGSCCAAASLSAEGATEGVGPLEQVADLGDRYPERRPPVEI